MNLRNLAVAAIAAAGLAGCVADGGDATLLVLHNQAPASGCVIDSSKTAPFLAAGVIDVSPYRADGSSAGRGYFLTPLVENTSFADTSDPAAVGRRTAIVKGAHVDISFLDTSEFDATAQAQLQADGLTQFDAIFAGSIEPNYGLTSFGFDAVPAGLLDAIVANHPYTSGDPYTPFADVGMIVTIKVFGVVGGNSIESNEFAYPVTVCDECLISDVGDCSVLDPSFSARDGGACAVNQDGVTDCCEDLTNNTLLCPAVSSSTGGGV
jgi:hypothetical protein